jgi:putative two-component system response regulator
MAVADVYDALRSSRPYKQPMSAETAMAIIMEGRGRHFDPAIVDAFVELNAEIIDIAERWPDA